MELESLGKEPISQEQPTGTDARFEPVFEELQAEIAKLSSISGPGSVDWKKTIQLASEILAQKSKDLMAASYLAVALIYNRQIEGFGIGLKVFQDLLENYWENLYPGKNRMRARVSAIEWWVEKAENALKQLKQKSLPADQLKSLKESVGKINQFLNQNLEEPISFSAIQDQLENFSPPPPEEPKEGPLAPSEKVSRPEPQVSEVIASAQDAQRALNYGLQKVREATTFLWQENLSNPLTYRWARIMLWSNIETLPPATDGKTRIPPPPPQIKNSLSDLVEKGDREGLIKAAEARLPQFIFWIDLNRMVSGALANLGDPYQKAKEAVNQETAFLLHRLPGLEHFSFSDGTPFADPETQQWLKEIAFKGETGVEEQASTSIPSISRQEKNPIEKEVEEAQALIKKGKLLEAIEGLQQKFQHPPSQREKLLWRLALSQLLIKNKQTKIVFPHLEQILNDIEFYRLEEYEPELALKALKVAWQGLNAQSDQTSKDKALNALHRIAKLDLTEAIRIGKT